MKKLFFLATFFLAAITIAYSQSPTSPTEPTDQCGWTYSQGFAVGVVLGNSETYFGENYNAYNATRKLPCSLYTAGVIEGYAETAATPPAVPGYNPCNAVPGHPQCTVDPGDDIN